MRDPVPYGNCRRLSPVALETLPASIFEKPSFFKEINELKSQNASSVRTFPYLPMARWMPQKVLLFLLEMFLLGESRCPLWLLR
jgi:hypothetical protein